MLMIKKPFAFYSGVAKKLTQNGMFGNENSLRSTALDDYVSESRHKMIKYWASSQERVVTEVVSHTLIIKKNNDFFFFVYECFEEIRRWRVVRGNKSIF